MKDQHTKIKGYRDLSQAEIDLMNAIKGKAEEVGVLIQAVRKHINAQEELTYDCEYTPEPTAEQQRIIDAEPHCWCSKASDDLQTGFMKLIRSVAQPTTF